jgi:exonuclease V gamma subunit
MKYLLSFILFFAPISSQPADHLQLSDLDELRWKNRIILIFSNDFDTYKKQLEASSDEIADRDIIWFIVSDSGIKNIRIAILKLFSLVKMAASKPGLRIFICLIYSSKLTQCP